MLVKPIDNEKDFFSLEMDWKNLQEKTDSKSIFLTWDWMVSWWTAYGRGSSLKILTVYDNDRLCGIAPFYASPAKKFAIPFNTLYLLGDGSFDSDYLDFLLLPGEEENVVNIVVQYFMDIRYEWDILLLNEVPEDAKTLAIIKKETNKPGFYVAEQTTQCPYIDIPDTWDAYLQVLKPRMRTKIRSLCRKLEDNYTVEFEICRSTAELQEKLTSLFDLHQQRWELKDQQGVFERPGKQKFYYEMAEKFLQNNWLKFYSLKVNNQYVAHQFCFEYQGTMSLLQEGFDPDWLKNGVGNVLRAYVIKDCIKRKVHIYDFLAGVTQHKMSWGAQLNTNIRLAVGRRTMKNWIYFRLPTLLRKIKHALMTVSKKKI